MLSREMRLNLLALLTLAATVSPALADWDQVKARAAGDQIQVRSGRLWDWGKFVRASDQSLVIQMRTGEATIDRNEVDEVRVFLRGKERGKQALKQSLAAAAVVGGIGYPVLRLAGNPRPGLMTGLFSTGPVMAGAIASGSKRIYKRKR